MAGSRIEAAGLQAVKRRHLYVDQQIVNASL
jgi:hypothetical protein